MREPGRPPSSSSPSRVRPAFAVPFLLMTYLAPFGTRAAAQVVEGRLLDGANEEPVVRAMVALADTTYEVVQRTFTDDRGAFRLEAPGPGDYYVMAHATGYEPAVDGVLELGADGYIEVTFYVVPRPIELEGITATAERRRLERRLDLAGFYDRRDRGFGDFIGPEELERRQPVDPLGVFRTTPGIRVTTGFPAQGLLCEGGTPRVFVDGVRVVAGDLLTRGFPLEEVARADDIAAVEVYRRASSVPLQFGGTRFEGCTVLVWTKGGN